MTNPEIPVPPQAESEGSQVPAPGQEVREAGGDQVPAGVQVSAAAGPGRRTHDVSGRPVPEDEQLLEQPEEPMEEGQGAG